MPKDFHLLRKLQTSIKKIFEPVLLTSPGTWLVNILVQRFFFVNRKVPWMVHYTSRVTVPQKIQIGKKVWVSFAVSGGCYIQGVNGVIIGDYTIFAPGVKMISADHDPDNLERWSDSPPIQIGDHCWIGTNAVLLAGTVLGDRCVVGAGSVVTKSFPAGSVIGGVPAKLLRNG